MQNVHSSLYSLIRARIWGYLSSAQQDCYILLRVGDIMRTPLHPEVISAIQKAVEEEAEALQLSLDHPHIVRGKADLLSLAELAAEYEPTRDDG